MAGDEVAPRVTPLLIDYRIEAPVKLRACFEISGFTVLLGRSGVGKTSLLRALAGLGPAIGTPWSGVPPERRAIGYLPQEALLFPHLSVLENTAYALRGSDRLARARALLVELGLEALAERNPAQLSGGQAKRVALARALARGVDLLLLDEPSAGLDGLTRDSLLDWLFATTTRRQVLVLAATHDPQIAARADQVALLVDGQILQNGPAREVFAAPCSRSAAELLGYDNIFERAGRYWAIQSWAMGLAPEGDPLTVLTARETGLGLRLTCGPAPCVTVMLPRGRMEDYPPGTIIRLDLGAAVPVG